MCCSFAIVLSKQVLLHLLLSRLFTHVLLLRHARWGTAWAAFVAQDFGAAGAAEKNAALGGIVKGEGLPSRHVGKTEEVGH